MNSHTRHQDRIKELWEVLEATPAADRQRALDEVCPKGHELRAELERLVEASLRESPDPLRPHGQAPPDSTTEVDFIPRRIGPYEIEGLLGKGGMGFVFRARQNHPITRTVALKVLRPGAATAGVIARFDIERRALCQLSHRNLARILDAGEGPHGGPYIVMELVEGPSLTAYSAQHALTTQQCVDLIIQTCAGVEHAHARGLIHRDLKPTNILIATEDGQPVPKVIDFGIARIIAQDDQPKMLRMTQAGQMFGTPEYMSPEQVDPDRREADVRSDVYSLGVVLYELVAGALPFEASRYHPETLDALRSLVCDEPTPSPRERRRTGTRANAGRIDRDVETVILKACEKDPARRYQTVRDFAEDLARFRRGEPVLARSPSLAYRARKFALRNKIPVSAAAITVFGLVAGLIFALDGRARAEEALRIASSERDIARRAQEDSEQYASFMRDAIWQATPMRMGHKAVMLDVIQASTDKFLASPPKSAVARGRVVQSFAEPLFWGQDLERTRKVLEVGISTFESMNESEAPDRYRTLSWLNGMLGQISELQGDLSKSAGLRVEALRTAELSGDPIAVANAMRQMAWLRIRQGNYEEALSMRQRTLAIVREHGADAGRIFDCQREIGHSLLALARYSDVVEQGLPAIQERSKAQIRGDYVLLDMQVDIAEAMIELGRLAEAQTLLTQTLERASVELPEDSGVQFRARIRLCRVRGKAGDAANALSEFREVIKAGFESGGSLPVLAEQSEPNIVEMCLYAKQLDEARSEAERVTKSAGTKGPDFTSQVALAIATMFLAEGHAADAEKYFLVSYSAYSDAGQDQASQAAFIAGEIAKEYTRVNDGARAREWAERAGRR